MSVIAVALAYKIADPSMVIPGNPVAKAFTELWFGIWVISFSFAFKEGFNTSLDKMNLPKRATYLRKLSPLTEQARIRASRSEEHTYELQSLMRISYAVFCLKKKTP